MTVRAAREWMHGGKLVFGDQDSIDALLVLELYAELLRRCVTYRKGKALPAKFSAGAMAQDAGGLKVLLGIGYAKPQNRRKADKWQNLFDAAERAECSSPKSASGETASA